MGKKKEGHAKVTTVRLGAYCSDNGALGRPYRDRDNIRCINPSARALVSFLTKQNIRIY